MFFVQRSWFIYVVIRVSHEKKAKIMIACIKISSDKWCQIGLYLKFNLFGPMDLMKWFRWCNTKAANNVIKSIFTVMLTQVDRLCSLWNYVLILLIGRCNCMTFTDQRKRWFLRPFCGHWCKFCFALFHRFLNSGLVDPFEMYNASFLSVSCGNMDLFLPNICVFPMLYCYYSCT